MNWKSFAAGLVVGFVLTGAAFVTLFRFEPGPVTETPSPPAAPRPVATSPEHPGTAVVRTGVYPDRREPAVESAAEFPLPEPGAASGRPAAAPTARSPVALPEAGPAATGPDDAADRTPESGSNRFPDRSELESQPRDDAWAYFTEDAIRQFLGTHPSSVNFDVTLIECRSTLCQIEAFGYDASAWPIWSQLLFDLRQQPWSEFNQTGSSSSEVDGRFLIQSKLRRVGHDDQD